MKRFEKLPNDPLEREEEVLSFWRENETFAKSLSATEGGPRYVFYEGPPTANGRPHFGHLMPRVYKDLFPRYKTMQGFHVPRKGGWDTHGLPVELEVEHEIGLNSKPEIETYGIERFVEKCKESVWKYKSEWERMIERMGFWIDLENAYVTYTDEYIESVWWELSQIYEKGLLYRGHKVLPYCPRCGTGLSSHEVAQGYRRVEDPSISVRMRIASDADSNYKQELPGKTALLTWTTTPWTLPANVALAVAADATYVEVEIEGERLIVAKDLAESAIGGDYRLVREFPGADLIGLAYEPPYRLIDDPRAYRVHSADFVNMEEGTGIVHTAPAFGEDDYNLGREKDLPFFHPVDLSGKFTDEFPLCAGTFVKEADREIVDDLKERGLLYRYAPYEHDYPFCWRCDTPLLYYAMDSWYIKTTAVKDELIENNRKINWYPMHVGEGRLGDFLENLKDWALSRDRYWGTPLNLWVCDACGETVAVGSRKELVDLAIDPDLARTVELHRPYIDRVELRCPKCGGAMRRVPNVIDTWFDSGSMHTAQWHYPFENEDEFKENFPADFISEGVDQTRGWFYTLLATSTILYGLPAFKNCVVTGLGLDENGVKMSKSKGNVIDPWDLIGKYGADTLRWYLYSSSAPWKSKRLGEEDVKEPLYKFLDTLKNSYDFFALYASIDRFDPARDRGGAPTVLDRWILSRLSSTTAEVVAALDSYDVVSPAAALERFVDELSNWYIRTSRRRFWKGGMGEDKIAAYSTLYRVLVDLSKLLAPFVPFLSEAIYLRLRTDADPESVHLCRYPKPDGAARDEELEKAMDLARRIASLGHQARHQAQVKVRQPLSRVIVSSPDGGDLPQEVLDLLKTELNVEEVLLVPDLSSYMWTAAAPNFPALGPRLGRAAQAAGKWIESQDPDDLRARLADGPVTAGLADGTKVEIAKDDVEFFTAVPEGFVLSGEGGLSLLLDTRIDDRLREKGLLREIVHRIQLLRKEAGFEVTDRIRLAYDGDQELCRILEENGDFVRAEVLATEMSRGGSSDCEYRSSVEIEGSPVGFCLSRVKEG